uniref:PHD finger protein 14 (inferred by orthology to a human protein) n=1 Tax=Strongyloides venezuelensis TaxID=75913 RepID=A0A0K0G273_STRVS
MFKKGDFYHWRDKAKKMSNTRNDNLKRKEVSSSSDVNNCSLLDIDIKNFRWNTCAFYRIEKFSELLSMIGHQHITYSSGGCYRYYKCKESRCPAKLRIHSKKDNGEVAVFVRQVHVCGYDWDEIVKGDGLIRLGEPEKVKDNVKVSKSTTSIDRKRRRKSDNTIGKRKKNDTNEKLALSFACDDYVQDVKIKNSPTTINHVVKKTYKKEVKVKLKSKESDSSSECVDEKYDNNKNGIKNSTTPSRSSSSPQSSRGCTPVNLSQKNVRPKRKSAMKAMRTTEILSNNEEKDNDDFEDSDDDDYTEESVKSSDGEDNDEPEEEVVVVDSNNQPSTSRRFQSYTLSHIDLKKFCGFCLKDEESGDSLLQCTGCKIRVHEHCYYVKNTFQPDTQRILSPWFCNECLSDSGSLNCVGCHEKDGPMKQTENGWIHGFCALYNNDIYEALVDNLEGPFYLTKSALSKKKYRCIFCDNPVFSCIGFTIQCEADKCSVRYHPMCGLKYGATFNIFPDDGYRNLSITHCPLHSTSESEKTKSYSIYQVFKKEYNGVSSGVEKKSSIQEPHKKSFNVQKKLMDNAYKEWLSKVRGDIINCSLTPIPIDLLSQLIDKEKRNQPNFDLSKSFDNHFSKAKSFTKEISIIDKKCNELQSNSLQNVTNECLSLVKKANLMPPKLNNNKGKLNKFLPSDCIVIMTHMYEQIFPICDDLILKVVDMVSGNLEEDEVIDRNITFIRSFVRFKKDYLKYGKSYCSDEDTIKMCMINLYKCLYKYANYFESRE